MDTITVGEPVEGTNAVVTNGSWKRRSTEKPYLSWCLIARNASKTIEATLRSLRERTPDAEIVIVETFSNDDGATWAICEQYADVLVQYAGPRGDWTKDMPWFDDAAAARQHSFELASGRWRGWIDADDRLAGPEEVERLLKLNNRWQPLPKEVEVADKKLEGPQSLENLLRYLEEVNPHAECVWAPYLYQRDANDLVMQWQDRERLVLWNPKRWKWSEPAHEILTPIGQWPPRVDFSHLLFVHEKDFTMEEGLYSLRRHYDVMSKRYDAGERVARDCWYLAAYARAICPEREMEYIDAAHDNANQALDRYRALLLKGNYYAARGFFFDALEMYGACTHLHPELPDAWFQGAAVWSRADDLGRVISWCEKGLACQPGDTNSLVNPRDHVVRWPTFLAEHLVKLATLQAKLGQQESAQMALERAVTYSYNVFHSKSIGADNLEAQVRLLRVNNAFKAQKLAVQLDQLCQFLADNDEPQKIFTLLQAVPWNLQDHAVVIKWEQTLRPLAKHLDDPEAYNAFYRDEIATGLMHAPDSWFDPRATNQDPAGAAGRVRWAAEWINSHCPNAAVLDVGCCDGVVGIMLLKMCPGITYHGVDLFQVSLDQFASHLEKQACGSLAPRAHLHCVDDVVLAPALDGITVDVLLWTEVIEHVPSAVNELRRLSKRFLKEDGVVLLTTPWGSYDAGHPPPTNAHGVPRGIRGHVRAFTMPDMVKTVEEAECFVDDLIKQPTWEKGTGDGMFVTVRRADRSHAERQTRKRASFIVPGALWDWNSRHVHAQGMGASEETIVYLAKELAAHRPVSVYGPVPSPEVHHRVPYFTREQVRHLRDGKLVISRTPAHAKRLDEQLGVVLPKLLWLQDAMYPDLNADVAKGYEKIIVVSNWHKETMHRLHGVPLDQMEVLYNFILPEHFRQSDLKPRKRDAFVYLSSPDRGLVRLLQLWPAIRAKLPEATLDIYYGWRGCEKLGLSDSTGWTKRFETMRRLYENLRYQPGLTDHGMVDHLTLARKMCESGVWAYPTDFQETGCCAVVKARAAGMVPVCPPLAALAETARCVETMWAQPENAAGFVEACVEATQVSERDRQHMAEEAQDQYALSVFLPAWQRLLDA